MALCGSQQKRHGFLPSAAFILRGNGKSRSLCLPPLCRPSGRKWCHPLFILRPGSGPASSLCCFPQSLNTVRWAPLSVSSSYLIGSCLRAWTRSCIANPCGGFQTWVSESPGALGWGWAFAFLTRSQVMLWRPSRDHTLNPQGKKVLEGPASLFLGSLLHHAAQGSSPAKYQENSFPLMGSFPSSLEELKWFQEGLWSFF